MTVLRHHFLQKKTQPGHSPNAQSAAELRVLAQPVPGRAQVFSSLLAAGVCHREVSVPVGHKSPVIRTLRDGPARWQGAHFKATILILHFPISQMPERSLDQQRQD